MATFAARVLVRGGAPTIACTGATAPPVGATRSAAGTCGFLRRVTWSSRHGPRWSWGRFHRGGVCFSMRHVLLHNPLPSSFGQLGRTHLAHHLVAVLVDVILEEETAEPLEVEMLLVDWPQGLYHCVQAAPRPHGRPIPYPENRLAAYRRQ